MATITRRRHSGPSRDFEYRVWWIDNADVEHERYFDLHRDAVQFVIETESALLAEAVETFNAALAVRSSARLNVQLGATRSGLYAMLHASIASEERLL